MANTSFTWVLAAVAAAALRALSLLFTSPATAQDQPRRQSYAAGRILVKFKPEISRADKAALHQAQGDAP